MPLVQKSIVARDRHRRVAAEYRKWLERYDTPKTPRKRRIEMFDLLCDSAYLDQELKRGAS